jgi:hypothetical protein
MDVHRNCCLKMPDAQPAKGVAQMFAYHHLLLVTSVLAAALSGCGLRDAWLQRSHREPVEAALHVGAADGSYRSHPDSSPSEVFNENYDPYNGQYAPYSPQPRRFAPPPAPPAHNNETTSNLNQQNSQTDRSAADEQLIRTLKTPRIFSPDSVRGIYDRIRGSQGEQPHSEPIKREGPIALRHNPLSPTQPCGYDELEVAATSPVRLGIPETQDGPLLHPGRPQLQSLAEFLEPAVVQACPSCYKHPMYADPMTLTEFNR